MALTDFFASNEGREFSVEDCVLPNANMFATYVQSLFFAHLCQICIHINIPQRGGLVFDLMLHLQLVLLHLFQ